MIHISLKVSKMQERHDILWNSIGYLQEEQDALDTGIMIRDVSLSAVIVGSLLETGFFYLYNGMFHPLANILKEPKIEVCFLNGNTFLCS